MDTITKSENKLNNRKTILYCPLNWGLGHASRGIYIIRKLLDHNFKVILGAEGESLALLRKEFPDLPYVSFHSFRVEYTKRFPLMVKLLFHLPVMAIGIAREHRMLKHLIRDYKVDLVISDNRYGLWNRAVTTVIITHQLSIRLPSWLSLFQYPLYRLISRRLRKFNHLWIPDQEGGKSLSGDLSQKYPIPLHARFIGIVSRFMDNRIVPSEESGTFSILVILSGPEPQRSILEDNICNQLEGKDFNVLVVRGLPSGKEEWITRNNIVLAPHLPSDRLKTLISTTETIISRAGYTSIMDLVVLKRKAILIPTPGQTEQEYLARYMAKQGFFLFSEQKNFNLEKAIDKLDTFMPCIRLSARYDLLDKAIQGLSLLLEKS